MEKEKNVLLLILKKKLEKERKKKITRRYWVRKIFDERKTKGEFHLLIKDLKLFDNEYVFKYFRMSPNKFEDHSRRVFIHFRIWQSKIIISHSYVFLNMNNCFHNNSL